MADKDRKDKNYKLSPSDFSFLYEGCKRCFYLKVTYGILQPSIPLPSIFSKIGGLLKTHYNGKSTKELHSKLPPGIVRYEEKQVKSEIIKLNGHIATCFISGRFDVVVEFADRTYGVIDFKTGNPNKEHNEIYSRQLHAYAYALEHSAPGSLGLSPISKIGLLYFSPSKTSQSSFNWISYDAEIQWVEIDKNETDFLGFLGEVLGILESPVLPAPDSECQWCSYVDKLKKIF